MTKGLISIPRIGNRIPQKNTIEWQIPKKVSIAVTLIDKFGYALIAKVKVKKKHWWSRSWKTFTTHASTPTAAIKKGSKFLEKYGYTIGHNTDQFKNWTRYQP